jgi:hypothetical protein
VSAVAKAIGTGTAVAGAGTWISLGGWPAAVAVGACLAAGVALLLFVLTSDARTARVLSIIAALTFKRS